MSDWFVLGLVATFLYLIECLVWIEAAAVACFKLPLRAGWRCAKGTTLPGNDRGGVVMVDPLSVRGGLVACHVWPVSISPYGLTNLTVDSIPFARFEPRYIAFDELAAVRAEFGEIRVNGERFARLNSSVLATQLAGQIQTIWQRPLQERASEISAAIEQALDDQGVAAAVARFQQRTRTLSACCLSLFAFLFLMSPLVLLLIGPYPAWKYLLLMLLLMTVTIAIGYFRTHAALYPQSGYDRWVQTLSMILLPVSAIRCVDKLSRDALCRYSPAVVLPILCDREIAAPVLRRQFIDLQNGLDTVGEDDAVMPAMQCARWFHEALTLQTKAALDRLNVAVLHAPIQDDEAMVSYCPRCHAQFGCASSESCPACSGIRLASFHPGIRT